MLVSQLIIQAYYKSGIVSPDAESPQTRQISDGLNLLNECIRFDNIGGETTPFLETGVLSITTIPGQESYIISGLTSVETVTLLDGNIRYELMDATTREYFGSGRALNIMGLPSQYFLERHALDSYTIYLYSIPAQAYQLNIKGAAGLSEANLSDEIDDNLDFYCDYYTYKLADAICTFNKLDTPPQTIKKLNEYQQILTGMSLPDLKIKSSELLCGNTMPSYAQLNIGRGWTR